ncbi:MAG TPA: GNAT family protein [Myxococcota bacterium]|nr:GNAT family protein [Myxococcota bacterium]
MIATRALVGCKLRLLPQRLEHAALLARWIADAEVRHWLHRSEDPPELLDRAAVEQRIREVLADPSEIRFTIEADDRALIGDVGLLGIHRAGRAELSILIGERSRWSCGYGADAIRTLLRFGFGELGLRRVTLIADADNARGIRCYERCGFRHEGVLRAHRLRYGEPLDMVAMAVLRDEFAAAERDGGAR